MNSFKFKRAVTILLFAALCITTGACKKKTDEKPYTNTDGVSVQTGAETVQETSEANETNESNRPANDEAVITGEASKPSASNESEKKNMTYAKIKVSESQTHQTMESFGASEAWWSQYVGGWTNIDPETGLEMREKIARYLYSKEDGIGLTLYRYNLGAGTVENDAKGDYWDDYRKAQCFETEPGVYDFTKDANAVWFMKRCAELCGEEFKAVFFCNSPLTRLTNNKKGYLNKGTTSNIQPSNYDEFAKYVLDVTEHFVTEEGINVTEISPVNEPQWDWFGGQEGCHYEPAALVNVFKVFLNKLSEREALQNVKLSGPESGEWGGRTNEYLTAMFSDSELKDYFDTIDCHSYWTTSSTKVKFKKWVENKYPQLKLRTSEWCEMVNGDDYTMDSAFNMSEVIMDDLKILDVVSWQLWVAVAPGNYRDGLIYVNRTAKKCYETKRLWAFGNFTKFIRPGYTRVDIDNKLYDTTYKLNTVAFKGINEKGDPELVLVIINREGAVKRFNIETDDTSVYKNFKIYTTNGEYNLTCTDQGKFDSETVLAIDGESITTIVLN